MNNDAVASALILAITSTAIVAVGTLCWSAHYWPRIDYRCRSYRLDDRRIEIAKGVLWRQVANVPHSRLQHIDVKHGPLERKFGLAHIVIHTAGTVGASVTLEGLGHDTAVRIRDHLIGLRSDDAV